MDNKVSIIIPMFNASSTIEHTINSAINQTFKNIEIIVVDDGSTDGSVMIVKRILKKERRLKIFEQKNKGVSSARNCGIKNATGKYLFFVDSDDVIEKDTIKSLVLSQQQESLHSCRIEAVYKNHKAVILSREKIYKADDALIGIIHGELQGYACGYLFERKNSPLFNENVHYCEDLLYLFEYIKNNQVKVIEFLPEKEGLYIYNQNQDGVTRKLGVAERNIASIKQAMGQLRVIMDYKNEEDINSKTVELFEYELSRANRVEMRDIRKKYKLPKYSNGKIRYKLFWLAYKNYLCLRTYYVFRKCCKKLVKEGK